jgi:hypothetical protein
MIGEVVLDTTAAVADTLATDLTLVRVAVAGEVVLDAATAVADALAADLTLVRVAVAGEVVLDATAAVADALAADLTLVRVAVVLGAGHVLVGWVAGVRSCGCFVCMEAEFYRR